MITDHKIGKMCYPDANHGIDSPMFKQRPLEETSPYVWLDGKYVKVREGDRKILGFDIGLSEDAAFWTAFFWELVARSLSAAYSWSSVTLTRTFRRRSVR
ncbi:MAG: hypothetical protein C7B46_18615, partial [Sulfobacillus benefaciens]